MQLCRKWNNFVYHEQEEQNHQSKLIFASFILCGIVVVTRRAEFFFPCAHMHLYYFIMSIFCDVNMYINVSTWTSIRMRLKFDLVKSFRIDILHGKL